MPQHDWTFISHIMHCGICGDSQGSVQNLRLNAVRLAYDGCNQQACTRCPRPLPANPRLATPG
jgi:hypothetical protein